MVCLGFFGFREQDETTIFQEDSLPDHVQALMKGDYFVALDRTIQHSQKPWQRTIRGHYVDDAEIEVLSMPTMIGEPLDVDTIAFVFGEDRPLFERRESRVEEVGVARKHARIAVHEHIELSGVAYIVGANDVALRRDHVRLIKLRERSDRIPRDVKWIHIDLDEQTLVAYDGEQAVYATLVSSGKEGYDTPRGVFRIREKYVSITMNGQDPVDGAYEVEEVPWTMYYWKSYALHGAYWHNDFGQVRSHGCTNLSPYDARWLFEWTRPSLPEGWHGRRLERGTWVWFSRENATQPQVE